MWRKWKDVSHMCSIMGWNTSSLIFCSQSDTCKFGFGCDLFVGVGNLRTFTNGSQDLHLISEKQDISYVFKFPWPERMHTCLWPGGYTIIEGHEVAAHSKAPVQPSQYKLHSVRVGSPPTTFTLSSHRRRRSERSPMHEWLRGRVLPCLQQRRRKGKTCE